VDSAAAAAGLMDGYIFVRIDGETIERFEDIQRIVRTAAGRPLEVVVLRDGEPVTLTATPRLETFTDNFGNEHEIGLLGIQGSAPEFVKRDPATSVWLASRETVSLIGSIFEAVGQIIVGTRNAEELGGPLRIAEISGQAAEMGILAVVQFMAVISINLGLINLFPIPVLDGGHLLFYLFEAVRGRPLGERAQEYGFRIGLALVLGLMVFVTWNDLIHFLS
ncbi:MAG: RIP metalloprotease RseP, partial [Rhodothermales bacterium]|nr:RIP metalloprotease RseP [Rhodothermales bacterium]